MAESFSSVPGEAVPGEAWPGDPGTVTQGQLPVPPPGWMQRPVTVTFRNG